MEKDQNIITIPQAAELAERTTAAIWFAIKKKRLKAHRKGKRWFLTKEALEEYQKELYSRKFTLYKGKIRFDPSKGEYSLSQAAAILNVTHNKIYHQIRKRYIPFTKKKGTYVIDIKVIEYLKKKFLYRNIVF